MAMPTMANASMPQSRSAMFRGVPHDGDELDFSASISAQKIAAFVAFRFANDRQEFRLQHRLVGIGVLGLRVSVPDSCDHAILFCKDALYGARRFAFSNKVQVGPLYS